jgi:hypothetical protein
MLQGKLWTSQCEIDSSIFDGDSLERLLEWKSCIEEKIAKMEEKETKSRERMERGRKYEKSRVNGGGRYLETELPFSGPINLTRF